MAYIGELAAGGTAVFWACGALLFTTAGQRVGPNTVNISRLAIGFVMIAGLHLMMQGSVFPFETEAWRWGILVLSAVLGLVIGDGALFFAFVLIGPRLSMLVMTLVPVFSALFAWICFGEVIRFTEYIGMAVTIGAIGWVVSENRSEKIVVPATEPEKPQEHSPSTDKSFVWGIVLSLVGVLGQTSNLVVTKYALLDDYSELSATEVRIFVSLAVLLVFVVSRGQLRDMFNRITADTTALVQISIGALIGPVLGIWLGYIAIAFTKIGIASTIMALPPLLLIPLSARFLNDRVTFRAIAGTIIALAGVSLMFLL